jgi:hypothetical protein
MSSKSSALCASSYRHKFRRARSPRHHGRRDGAHRRTGSRAPLGRTTCGPRQRMTSDHYSKQLQCFATAWGSVLNCAQQYPEPSRRLRPNKHPSIKDQHKERVERKSNFPLQCTITRRWSSIQSCINAVRTSLRIAKQLKPCFATVSSARWGGEGNLTTALSDERHCQSKFYTACSRTRAGWSSTVFARELPPRSAEFNAENRLYSFALTLPPGAIPGASTQRRSA